MNPIETLVEQELEEHSGSGKTILYVGIRYDYGKPEWGLSYEHYNFYRTLVDMGYSLIYFDYDRLYQKFGGTDKISDMLLEACYYYHPDVLFYFNFHDWIRHDVWKEITEVTPTKTLIWLADDSWRYEETKPIWELFDTIITTDKIGYERRDGNYNIMMSQWGFNHQLYRRLNLPKIYDVSFTGRAHSGRKEFIKILKEQGINIEVCGQGWDDNPIQRISQRDMIRIYNQSKIVLNIHTISHVTGVQFNVRDCEATGCGSLLLTQDSEKIRECFKPDVEILTYKDAVDASEKIKEYLRYKDVLRMITEAGYNRALKDHTYFKRFSDIKELI